MYKAVSIVLLALPALASASLRGLQAATTPAVERVCNVTELDARLDALTAKPECATAWPAFSDAMDTDAWTKLSLDDQTQKLDDFCKSDCGAAFDAAVTEWRTWCDSTRASFEPIPADDDGKGYTLDGFVAEFGCAKSAAGGYCARIIMDELAAAPDNTTAKCAYFSSCCFGELSRVVKLGDMETRSATVETKCPGARDALAMRC